MSESKEIKHEPTEVEFFEFSRRWDEVSAIIDRAAGDFGTELELKEELKQHNEKPTNPWVWVFFAVSMGMSFLLREARWFEFKWEWNFGSFLLSICFLYYIGFLIEEFLIKRKQEANFQRLRDFEYRWSVATGGVCGSFWELRKFVNAEGEFEGDGYWTWYKEVHSSLSDKISLYSNQT